MYYVRVMRELRSYHFTLLLISLSLSFAFSFIVILLSSHYKYCYGRLLLYMCYTIVFGGLVCLLLFYSNSRARVIEMQTGVCTGRHKEALKHTDKDKKEPGGRNKNRN